MTDIHTHILFGIDDGSKSMEESLEMINKLSFLGFNNIVCTPHFIEGTVYCSSCEANKKMINELQKHTKTNLVLGNEVYINTRIDTFINNGYIQPIGENYLLIELPMNNEINDAVDIFYELKIKGYKVILAHPERYSFFQDNYQMIDKYHKLGILFQCNYGSIDGIYGYEAEKLLIYLLKKGWVHFLATDVHHQNSKIFDNFDKMENEIIKIIGKDYYQSIIENGDKIIQS